MGNEYKKIISDKKAEAEKLMTSKQVSDCNIAIHTASAAAAAGGVLPLPGVDAVPISAAQIAMVLALGKIFDQNITESAAKGIIGAAASTFVGRNLVKLIPIVGWGVSAVVAAGVTEAAGWSIAVDFAKAHKKNEENTGDEKHSFEEYIKKAFAEDTTVSDEENQTQSDQKADGEQEDSCEDAIDEVFGAEGF